MREDTATMCKRQEQSGSPQDLILVAKSKTMLFFLLHAFIPSVNIDFATRIKSGHQPLVALFTTGLNTLQLAPQA